MALELDEVPETFVTSAQLGAILKVDRVTVWRWAKAGQVPSVALPGGGLRFNLRAVLEALEAYRREGETAVDAALRMLGEVEQARPAPLCPACGRRERVGTDLCGPCTAAKREQAEASAELERARKRRNWERHGEKYRETQKAKARRTDG